MRKWASLRPDSRAAESFKRIMVYSSAKGTFVFLYESEDAVFCSEDEFYPSLEDALDAWEGEIDAYGWHVIDDPLPDCQHDCILPVRVKGRDRGAPQWGKFEILEDGEWKDFREDVPL